MRAHLIAQLPGIDRLRQCQFEGGHYVHNFQPVMIVEISPDNHNLGFTRVHTYCLKHGQKRLDGSTGDPRTPPSK